MTKWFIQIESTTHRGMQAYIADYGNRVAYHPGETIDRFFAFDSEEDADYILQKLLGEWSTRLPEDLLERLHKAKILSLENHICPAMLFAVVWFQSCCDDYYDAYQIVEGVFVSEKDAISHCMNSVNKEKVLYLFPVEAGKPWPTLPIENNPPNDLSWSCEEKRRLKELGAQAFFDGEAFNF